MLQSGAHIIQTAGGQLMLQTVGGTGSIQVAQAGGTQQLQQLQVVPASGIQVSLILWAHSRKNGVVKCLIFIGGSSCHHELHFFFHYESKLNERWLHYSRVFI